MIPRYLILLPAALLTVQGATHWVSPTGAAAWASCVGASPLTGTAACSMATANSNAAAGDVVNLMSGTYGTGIIPVNSGSAGNVITFTAYTGNTPTFSGTTDAIRLQARSYIKITGITVTAVDRFFFVGHGSTHNEISNSSFTLDNGAQYSTALITDWNTAFSARAPSTDNWIRGNTFGRYGRVNQTNCDDSGTIRVGTDNSDGSFNNTFEGNTFYSGGHDLLDVGTKFNVITRNHLHNEEVYFVNPAGCTNTTASGFNGNRNIIMTDYGSNTRFNLIEGNRTGHAGAPPDDDGANGVENAGAYTIVRYNFIFGNGAGGYYSKTQNSDNSDFAHVFNNTIYSNGFGDASISSSYKGSVTVDCNGTTLPQASVVKNNILYSNANDGLKTVGADCSPQFTMANNYTSNPTFVNGDLTDKASATLPNLQLQSSSAAIDGGTHLTQANGSGSSSTTLIVDDALYFQDGTWGSDLARGVTFFPDWIAIGTVGNTVQISSINYTTQTITLASAKTWSDNAPIWLYKKSDGAVVLAETAPDYGAAEFIPPVYNHKHTGAAATGGRQ